MQALEERREREGRERNPFSLSFFFLFFVFLFFFVFLSFFFFLASNDFVGKTRDCVIPFYSLDRKSYLTWWWPMAIGAAIVQLREPKSSIDVDHHRLKIQKKGGTKIKENGDFGFSIFQRIRWLVALSNILEGKKKREE